MQSQFALLALSLISSAMTDVGPITLAAKPLAECEGKVVRLAANEKGLTLLIATEQGNVAAWDVAKPAFTWRNAPGGLNNHSPAATEKDVPFLRALGVGDKFAFLGRGLPSPFSLDVATGKESSNYMALVSDPSVQIVALCCDSRDRWTWMAFENGVLARFVPNGGSAAYNRVELKNVHIGSLAYDADATLIAAGGGDGSIHFVNASSAKLDEAKVFKGTEAELVAMDFANNGALLLGANVKGDVCVWNVATGKVRQTVHASDAPLRKLIVHPKNKWFVTGDSSGVVKVWSLEKGALLATLTAEGATAVLDLAFIDGAKSLAGAVGGKNVVVWDVSKL
jgi:WD40 repeat protein